MQKNKKEILKKTGIGILLVIYIIGVIKALALIVVFTAGFIYEVAEDLPFMEFNLSKVIYAVFGIIMLNCDFILSTVIMFFLNKKIFKILCIIMVSLLTVLMIVMLQI